MNEDRDNRRGNAGKGVIALMGSGELTATMVEVHKRLLGRVAEKPAAVFIDTPAGFQLNVDQLSRRAVEYFRTHVGQPMTVASYKSREETSPYDAEQAFRSLREADFTLIGPGSPTYAVRQLRETPVPEILADRVEAGACLVAASAAALTVGRFTLPVYEIYKVGGELHWVEGLDILGRFGFDLAVIPHWNNAEGGTHDTRFCYMGKPRFDRLRALLPEGAGVLGLDEHTACLIDLDRGEAEVTGIGRVTLLLGDEEIVFGRGERIPLDVLRGVRTVDAAGSEASTTRRSGTPERVAKQEEPFWERVHAMETAFEQGLEEDDPRGAAGALLDLDQAVWKAMEDLENDEFISQAREMLREWIVLLGAKLEAMPGSPADRFASLVDSLLELRESFRKGGQWREADVLRDCLDRAEIVVEDTEAGPRWRIGD